jgi:hypothetical protein
MTAHLTPLPLLPTNLLRRYHLRRPQRHALSCGGPAAPEPVWNNLLTGQALTFNLFAPFKQNLALATVVMRRDCTAVAIECMAYADPAADAVHRGIYDASIVQAIGRVRPLERTASNPAVTWAFGNAELPFQVVSVTRWQDVRPDRLVRMVAHDAVWLIAEDAHAFEPRMFRSAKAAEHVRGRIADALEAVRHVVRHDRRPWLRVRYQLRGQGMHVREALAPAGAEAALRAAIEAEHGDLVQWHVLPFTPGREVIPELGKSGTYRVIGNTSPQPVAGLAKLTRERVAIAAVAAKQIATGPPDG